MRPSWWFGDSEEALNTICGGCDRETGWLDDPLIETPRCAVRVIEDEDALDESGQCPRRVTTKEAAAARERELYEKRMRGDWS